MHVVPGGYQQPHYGPTAKFLGDQNLGYGGKLFWPGIDGLPFRGDKAPILSPDVKQKLYCAGDAKHGTFDLSIPEQAEQYAWIRDRVRNGLFTEDYIERHWNDETKNQIIYLEWTQLFVQLAEVN